MWVTRNTYDVMRSPCTTLSYSAPSATVHAGIQAAGVSCRRSVRLSTYLIVASLHSFLPPHTCMRPPSLTHPLAFLSVASLHSLFLPSARGPRTCIPSFPLTRACFPPPSPIRLPSCRVLFAWIARWRCAEQSALQQYSVSLGGIGLFTSIIPYYG